MATEGMRKNFRRTIHDSRGRFFAIALIIALGAALFVGLRTTKDAMVKTVQHFMDDNLFYDFRVLNTYGFEEEAVSAFAAIDGIAYAEGGMSLDALVTVEEGKEVVAKIHALPEQINTVLLMEGRMPENKNECVVDAYYMDADDIGTVITVTSTNSADTLEEISVRELTVVGTVRSPLYINFERGSTSIGTGTVSFYMYVLPEALNLEVYTEVWLRMEGNYELYSDAYSAALDETEPEITRQAEAISAARLARILESGYAELADAEQQYNDGVAEYESERADAESALTEAAQQLEDGAAEIQKNENLLNSSANQLKEAQSQINDGKEQLEAGQQELDSQRESVYSELDSADAEIAENYAAVTEALEQVRSGISQIDDGLEQIESAEKLLTVLRIGCSAAESAVQTAESAKTAAQSAAEANPESRILQAALEAAENTWSSAVSNYESLSAQLEQLEQLSAQKEALIAQRESLAETEQQLESALAQLEEAKRQAENGRAQADESFAAAQAEIDAGAEQLADSQKQVNSGYAQVNSGKQQLAEAKEELEQGRQDYEQAVADAETGFAEAEEQLTDAAQQIADAYDSLAELEEPDTYVLTRETNVGYSCFEGDADIVKNVSNVFPIFFILIAALVCMTTMDKMVDEERSQIGTLKALGYSDGAILLKYVFYAGAASLTGSVIGCAVGSLVFTELLWHAYSIMYCLPKTLILWINWPLCSVVTAGYLAAMLGVTFWSCRRTMLETPAGLIRPQSPPAGKRLLIERLPFWRKVPFLHKVTWRNMFRYKKRLFMTLLGVGGCTALLVTGFGFRDSIINVANIQYSELMHYDVSVNFSIGQPEAYQNAFSEACDALGAEAAFLYQTSMDASANGLTKSVTLVVPHASLEGYWTIAKDGVGLEMPGENEVLVSRGIAEKLGLTVGDTLSASNSDMDTLEVTVSGIFDNNVQNYLIVSEETLALQWGREEEPQVAYVLAAEGADTHALAAKLMNLDYVINASVTVDFLSRIDNMMKSLNYIVYLIIGMAAGLAFIVLYNLTNININERIREIATIKVLGFRRTETSMYLFRESILLALFGSILGLVMGKFLHAFVMSTITIDLMSFDVIVEPVSYLISIVLTMVFAVFVNFVLEFRLEKINMAEALKAVE